MKHQLIWRDGEEEVRRDDGAKECVFPVSTMHAMTPIV